jgi:dipeptidase E
MRLYLSSYKIGNHPEQLVRLVGSHKRRVAIITNATDCYSEAETKEWFQHEAQKFHELGFVSERLDLRDYFVDNITSDFLKQFGLIWVCGGNTFILIRAIMQSGFDQAITPLLGDDAVVYGGYSAGACVATPTLRGLELCDDPNVIPEGYDKEIIWDGLDMVPFSIAPHYKSDHPETAMIDDVVIYYKNHRLPFETLLDGEAIIVNGDKMAKIV